MRLMRGLLWVLMASAFLGFAGTFALESSYVARAQRIQVVTIDKTQHSPFGPVPIERGNPVMLIVDDPAAFLKNKTATGLPMVDADYLSQHGESALELQHIASIIGLARVGCTLSLIVTAVGLGLLKWLYSTPIPPEL